MLLVHRILNQTLLIAISLLALACHEDEKDTTERREESSLQSDIDAYFKALTDLYQFNGVVLAYAGDSLVIHQAYNLHPEPDSSSFVTVQHQFDIHSVSKLMTYYLIVKLEAEERISQNQTISAFYPDFPRGDEITLKMLLEHTSGLPRELSFLKRPEIELTSADIVDRAKREVLLFNPGTEVQYSNVGYEILYAIVANVYEKPFAQCIQDEIFAPLGMQQSGAHFFTEVNRRTKLAQNHMLVDSVLKVVPNVLDDEFKTARLYSTAADLDTFLVAIEQQPYADSLKDENGVIAKDGGSKGIRAQVYTDLVNDFRFVILANYDQMPFFKTVEDVAAMLKGEEVELPKALNRKEISVPKEVLARYIGAYEFADFDGLVLRVDTLGKNLILFQGEAQIATLKAESETVFFENPKAAESFEFIQNESGTYNALMGWKGIKVEGKRK